jgi:hypothetical protein
MNSVHVLDKKAVQGDQAAVKVDATQYGDLKRAIPADSDVLINLLACSPSPEANDQFKS